MISGTIWQPPPTKLVLSSDEVHVWRASLNQPAWKQQLAQILSADEIVRAERFYFQQHRDYFIIGRGLLRTLLSRYLEIEPSRVEFCYGHHGKPALAETWGAERLQFNLSHSQGFALYAFTRVCKASLKEICQIGVDLEYLRPLPDAEQIAKRFFSVREHAVLSALPPNQQQIAFFNGWTRKEAYLKAIGDGLAYPLDQIEVTLAPGEAAQILSIAGDAKAASEWSIQELTPENGYVAALAVEGHNWELRCWQSIA